ncbi:Ankyrin repeat domain-containing protein 55 [Pseudocercospora fuligena]|uniref:Ankyrin repeat domain-containing protein 55 n=1 Tax=Pseudocercospora fuligena TaxID=685502 RepID=A0A8H6RBN4_9PEZI|nr:Ankyrin repeat domain-containing protein 55 [Pseudocercospora fuligena]
MMEALSGAGSVISVLQLAGSLIERSIWLYQQLQDAPVEVEAARNRLTLVRAELLALAGLDAIRPDAGFTPSTVNGLQAALSAAEEALKLTEAELQPLPANLRFKCRVKWALLGQRRSERVQRNLQWIESSLTTVILLLLLRNQNADSAVQKSASNCVLTCAPLQDSAATSELQSSSARVRAGRTSADPGWTRVLVKFAAAGLRAALINVRWANSIDWFISVHQYLPLAWLLGVTILQIKLNVRIDHGCRSLSSLPGSCFVLARLVEQDHPLISACRNGEVNAARRLLARKEGFVTDVTAQPAWPPLAHAIQGGSIELVRLLLDCGAGLDWTFGNNETSPLQLALWLGHTDIARLLLRTGANADYRSTYGFDLPYFAWSANKGVSALELSLKMLYSENGLDELNILDACGVTCLHHIAAYGSAEEAELLVRLGADPLILSDPLGWNALQQAIYDDNFETYMMLKKYCGPSIMRFVDGRGWTLLHLAAATGTRELIQDVLREGADIHALTVAATEFVEPSLFRKNCSPADIAANAELSAEFSEAVESYYSSQNLVVSWGDNQELEIFHDAVG